jgi:hypothetical protein
MRLHLLRLFCWIGRTGTGCRKIDKTNKIIGNYDWNIFAYYMYVGTCMPTSWLFVDVLQNAKWMFCFARLCFSVENNLLLEIELFFFALLLLYLGNGSGHWLVKLSICADWLIGFQLNFDGIWLLIGSNFHLHWDSAEQCFWVVYLDVVSDRNEILCCSWNLNLLVFLRFQVLWNLV